MIKLVGFDFDGTLAQSNAIKRDTFRSVSARLLGDASDVVESVLSLRKGDRKAIFENIVDRLARAGRLPPAPAGGAWAPALIAAYTEECEAAIAACPEVPGARRGLEGLRAAGFRLFINSATPLQPLMAVLAKRGLSRYFSDVYGNEGTKVGNIRRALASAGCGPEELVFVGDNEADRAAAAEIGCEFIGLHNGFSEYVEMPARLIEDLGPLDRLIAGIAAEKLKAKGGMAA